MAELINLRLHKKSLVREEKSQNAEANRQKFGHTKADRELTNAKAKLVSKTLDGHKKSD
jgi:Domain of unknown function (DUF4169)